MKKINVLLADDHQIIRDGLKLMLKNHNEINIVAEVGSGSEAIEFISNNKGKINVILMDINMPEMGGIEATQFITEHFKDIKILALTMHSTEKYITEMIKAGALGYVLKEAGTEEVLSAIKSVAEGNKYYSNDVSVVMIHSLMNQDKTKPAVLSERELEVLKYIALGYTCKEVGTTLFISNRTVETHKRNIIEKLELSNTAELIRYAITNKLVA